MRSAWVWFLLAVPAAWAVWQLQLPLPVVAAPLLGFFLLTLGVLAGMRIGTDGLARFTKDVTRLNKCLADQNDELAEMNLHLLRQLGSNETGEDQTDTADRDD